MIRYSIDFSDQIPNTLKRLTNQEGYFPFIVQREPEIEIRVWNPNFALLFLYDYYGKDFPVEIEEFEFITDNQARVDYKGPFKESHRNKFLKEFSKGYLDGLKYFDTYKSEFPPNKFDLLFNVLAERVGSTPILFAIEDIYEAGKDNGLFSVVKNYVNISNYQRKVRTSASIEIEGRVFDMRKREYLSQESALIEDFEKLRLVSRMELIESIESIRPSFPFDLNLFKTVEEKAARRIEDFGITKGFLTPNSSGFAWNESDKKLCAFVHLIIDSVCTPGRPNYLPRETEIRKSLLRRYGTGKVFNTKKNKMDKAFYAEIKNKIPI